MSRLVCPHCDAYSHFTVIAATGFVEPTGSGPEGHGAMQCNNPKCNKVLGGIVELSRQTGGKTGQILDWWPRQVGGRDFPDVPMHIAEAANEAYRCHSIAAHRAAVLLARSVIEATAKEKGITNGRLVTKIDGLHKAELIRKVVKEGAHEVRLFGNDMAHGDFVEPVDADDAEEVLELMAEVLNDVFQQEARVNRHRARRAVREES